MEGKINWIILVLPRVPFLDFLYELHPEISCIFSLIFWVMLLMQIEKFMFYIWKRDIYRNRLSMEEEKFTERCIRDIGKHLEETALSKLPDNYQSVLKQSIISEEDDMVPEPQLDSFVVAKCERATRPLYLDGSKQSSGFDSREDHFQMVPDDLCILRYRPFQEELMSGNISLV
ncbi:hypothetical protein CRYUN_Cryun36dG0104200 [Craigia yunnanensis]